MRKFDTTEGFILSKSENPSVNEIVTVQGYSSKGDGGAASWRYNGTSGQALSQSPAQLGKALLNDASGNQWALVDLGKCSPECLGLSEFRFYVSTTGDDTNLGLFSGFPVQTPQVAADNLAQFAPTYGDDFYVDFEAGTYTEGFLIDNVPTFGQVIVEGKLDGSNNQTVIFDGTSASTGYGFNFNGKGVKGRVRNVSVSNYSQNLIAFQNGAFGVVDTCNGSNVNTFGFNASENADMNIIGTCTVSCNAGGRGLRFYRNSTGSLGDNVNTITLDGNGNVADGMDIRNGAEVVCNNGIVVNNFNNNGITIRNGGFLELRDATISNSDVGLSVDDGSRFAEAGTLTYSNNNKDTEYSGFGIKEGLIGHQLIGTDGETGDSPSSDYDVILNNNGVTGLQVLSNDNNVRIDINKSERIVIDSATGRWRFYVNNVEQVQIRSPASNQAAMLILVNDGTNTNIRRVNVGSADSGGTGQRLLTVDN